MLKNLFFLPLSITPLFGQMITSSGASAFHLVQNTMAGYGIEILWVTSQGSSDAFGPFTGSGSTIGFDHGLVLTTGTVMWGQGPMGPNNNPSAGIDNQTTGYPLLTNINPIGTYNATAFEISFIPKGDSIFFTFVFGSEEYKEYVGSDFRDSFGAFLTGENPAGGIYSDANIAVIPGGFHVSVNTISHLTNPQLYVDNEDPTPGSYTQYDGYTVPITISAGVVPNTNYVLKIAIADVNDGIYDSGVFIKEHSFTSGEYIGIENVENNEVLIYPVPAENFLEVRSVNGQNIESISLTDGLGKIVLQKTIHSLTTTLDISELTAGMYMITIQTSQGSTVKKISIR